MNSAWDAVGLRQESLVERLAGNLVLFYVLVLAASLFAGLIGAVAGDGALTGEHGTIVYAAENPPVVETPNDDPQPVLVLVVPIRALYLATFMVLPAILIGLGLAELLSRIGVPPVALRGVAVGLGGLIALLVLSNGQSAGFAILALAVVAYATLFRLPPQPSLK